MTNFYLDTSVAVHAFLGTPAATHWFDHATLDDTVLSSRILRTELTRFLRRESIPVGRRNEVLDHVATVGLTDGILAGAEAIGDHVRTLDAIHLASALVVGSDVVVVTHDLTMARVAESLGLTAFDPLAA